MVVSSGDGDFLHHNQPPQIRRRCYLRGAQQSCCSVRSPQRVKKSKHAGINGRKGRDIRYANPFGARILSTRAYKQRMFWFREILLERVSSLRSDLSRIYGRYTLISDRYKQHNNLLRDFVANQIIFVATSKCISRVFRLSQIRDYVRDKFVAHSPQRRHLDRHRGRKHESEIKRASCT